MKLLVDMNLSPSWVERFVVITNDLDFSAILAAGGVDGPSVVDGHSRHLLPVFQPARFRSPCRFSC